MLRPHPEHHTVLIVGGGPAGLALAVVLGGWHPFYREGELFASRYPQLAAYLHGHSGSLLTLDFPALVRAGIPPVDLFRLLHHPSQRFQSLDQLCLDFRPAEPLDYLLLSREPVGGLWNHVPANLLTLSRCTGPVCAGSTVIRRAGACWSCRMAGSGHWTLTMS